jgi:hypothetical protein
VRTTDVSTSKSKYSSASCRGNGASVARIIPYAALHFSTYEYYRTALVENLSAPRARPDRPPVWVDLLAGSLSGVTAVAFTYPLDVVRTRLAWEVETHGQRMNHSIRSTILSIIREEGIYGLYRVCIHIRSAK